MEEIRALRSAELPDGSILYVVRERENKLIGRLEVAGVVIHEGKGTPKRSDVAEALSKLYSKPRELVVVKKIKSEYGMGRSNIRANIYDDINRLKSFEPEYILKRHG